MYKYKNLLRFRQLIHKKDYITKIIIFHICNKTFMYNESFPFHPSNCSHRKKHNTCLTQTI